MRLEANHVPITAYNTGHLCSDKLSSTLQIARTSYPVPLLLASFFSHALELLSTTALLFDPSWAIWCQGLPRAV
jgi:hypothetical protein